MRTMLQRYPYKASALGRIHRVPAVLHVEARLKNVPNGLLPSTSTSGVRMRTMQQCYPHEAGALGEVHRLPAVLHVEALLHATRAHQCAVAPRQHGVHDARTGGPPPEPPPQMPHYRAVEALWAMPVPSQH